MRLTTTPHPHIISLIHSPPARAYVSDHNPPAHIISLIHSTPSEGMRSATGVLRILDDKTQDCLGQLEAARTAIDAVEVSEGQGKGAVWGGRTGLLGCGIGHRKGGCVLWWGGGRRLAGWVGLPSLLDGCRWVRRLT